MKRYFTNFLLEWKERQNRKPLIIRGARQVGKTWITDEFGNENFDNYLKINLEENEEARKIFKSNNPEQIIESLSLLLGKSITAGNSLLFIDEIQTSPKAIAGLRYFYEKMPNLHVIAAGSLLDHALNEMKYSMPVGRVEFAYMYPLNFREFLWALGENQLADFLDNFKINDYIADAVHLKLVGLLRKYFFIGGMPEAVKTYSDTGDLLEVERVRENILKSLEYDFAKYGSKTEQQHLATVFKQIPKTVGRKLKYVNISRAIRPEAQRTALHKLEMSRIIKLVRHSNSASSPLEYGAKEIFKPQFIDIGLLNHQLKVRLIENEKIMTAHEGALAEQFTGQELLTIKPYFMEKELFYWLRESKNSNAELDFLYEHNNQIIPIEVKSGKAGTLKSLYVFAFERNKKYGIRFNINPPSIEDIETKIRIKAKNEIVKFKLLSLPLYLSYRTDEILNDAKL
ncbi:MAG: AAA family ATPase [Bacteroidota bacterium]|nr:AAA family ATPase [Bacteroidota bacterium]